MTLYEFYEILINKWEFWDWLLKLKVNLFSDYTLNIEQILIGFLGIVISAYIINIYLDSDIAFIFNIFDNEY